MDCECFDTGYDLNKKRNVQGSWYGVLAYNGRRHAEAPSVDTHSSYEEGYAPGYIISVMLEIAQDNLRTYRRIGLFAHLWNKAGPNPMAGKYPESAILARLLFRSFGIVDRFHL